MKTLTLILFALLGLMFLYRFEEKCASYKDVVIWEEDGVEVHQQVKVYDCK